MHPKFVCRSRGWNETQHSGNDSDDNQSQLSVYIVTYCMDLLPCISLSTRPIVCVVHRSATGRWWRHRLAAADWWIAGVRPNSHWPANRSQGSSSIRIGQSGRADRGRCAHKLTYVTCNINCRCRTTRSKSISFCNFSLCAFHNWPCYRKHFKD